MRCKHCGHKIVLESEREGVLYWYHVRSGFRNCKYHETNGYERGEFYAEPFKFEDYLKEAEECVANIAEWK